MCLVGQTGVFGGKYMTDCGDEFCERIARQLTQLLRYRSQSALQSRFSNGVTTVARPFQLSGK